MKTVLLTGGTGFLGSYIARALVERCRLVLAKRSFSDTFRLQGIFGSLKTYNIDCCPLERIFEENPVDVIIHAATKTDRDSAYEEIHRANVEFPLRLAKLAEEARSSAFVNIDTYLSAVRADYPYISTYLRSKKTFVEDFIGCAIALPFLNVRMEHIYGPNDSPLKFVPRLAADLLRNKEQIALSPGKQRRDFIFVEDAAQAFVCIVEHIDELTGPRLELGVGSGRSTSIREFVSLMHQLCRSSSRLLFGALPYRDGEIMDSSADVLRLKELGWQQRVSLEEGLKRTLDYELGKLRSS